MCRSSGGVEVHSILLPHELQFSRDLQCIRLSLVKPVVLIHETCWHLRPFPVQTKDMCFNGRRNRITPTEADSGELFHLIIERLTYQEAVLATLHARVAACIGNQGSERHVSNETGGTKITRNVFDGVGRVFV